MKSSNLEFGTITISMEYAREMNKTTMKGLFVKKGFFHGLPIVKLIKVKIYMKLVKRKRMLVSGVILMKSYSSMYLCLFTPFPPMLL